MSKLYMLGFNSKSKPIALSNVTSRLQEQEFVRQIFSNCIEAFNYALSSKTLVQMALFVVKLATMSSNSGKEVNMALK